MSTLSFTSSIFLAGVLLVSAGAYAQESPYEFWELQVDDLVEGDEIDRGAAQNDALFSLPGTSFGGDGRTTFSLPDLRGRTGNSSVDTIPYQIRRRSQVQTESIPTNVGFQPWRSDYYITETHQAISTGGYRTSFRSRENFGDD